MKTKFKLLAVGAAAAGMAFAMTSHAQTAEALMDALVRKGLLTEQEAEDIKADVAKENHQYNKLNLMGKTVTGLNLYGDFRGRFERFESANSAFVDRNRFRYRLRFGATYSLSDNFEVGFRLSSSEANSSFGGDSISGNTTFQDNASKKFIYIDQAYGRWSPFKGPDFSSTLTVGKMENPFVFSDMVFDPDYTPEGIAGNFGYQFNAKHSVKLNLGGFVLDEIGGAGNDPYLLGAQVRWDANWTPKFQTSMGVAWLGIFNQNFLGNAAVPNVNRGNTREVFIVPGVSTNMVPANEFMPIVLDASATYTLDKFPLYAGPFPIKVAADYMGNYAAGGDNYAYSIGLTFGKAGKKKTWELGYTWKWLGADSWWEELPDSDFGGFYGGTLANSGSGTGYGAGTNVKGHVIRFAYSPSDSITFSVKWFLTELINEVPSGSESEMNRLQVDANWKF